jgi:hypothetical protein
MIFCLISEINKKWLKMAIFVGQKCCKLPQIGLFGVFRWFLVISNFFNFRRKLADFLLKNYDFLLNLRNQQKWLKMVFFW